jgi:hypothetical protein
MKGVLTGGMWDQTQVEVAEIPPEYVILGTPSVVYRYARVITEKDEQVVIYEVSCDRKVENGPQ